MARHIGMVGISPTGAALCYRQIFRHARTRLDPREHPRLTVTSLPLIDFVDAVHAGDWHRVGSLLRLGADALAAAGAELCFTPDNVVQHAIPLISRHSSIPWISMAETVADHLARDGRTVVGILGTRNVTSGSTYQAHLGLRGIRIHKPHDAEADIIERIVLTELVHGSVSTQSTQALHTIVEQMGQRGCDAVLFGCSEAPILVEQGNWALPTYDACDIIARHVLEASIGPAAS